MNARKGYILASLGFAFLAASLLLGTPLRGPSEAAIDAAVRGIKVVVMNPPESPVRVSQVSDPAALRKPFVNGSRWTSARESRSSRPTSSTCPRASASCSST